MSELRIALVAEGSTDYVIVEAALKAFLTAPFILTQLQPEETRPGMGTGWGGVLKWCWHAGERHSGDLETDPTLANFDLLILHLDVDVATFRYSQCGEEVADIAHSRRWGMLPCARSCPPVRDSCLELEAVVSSWLGSARLGRSSVLCLPAQSSGSWLAAAVLPPDHQLLANHLECDGSVEPGLCRLPRQHRIKKTRRDYQRYAQQLTENWAAVKSMCSQARVFENSILAAIG